MVCPFWAGSPYEMLVVPTDHEGQLARAMPRPGGLRARPTRAPPGCSRWSATWPTTWSFHTAPHHEDALFHWHVHVVPRLSSVAGFEQGTGVLINIVAPEDAAAQLRSAGPIR